MDDRSEHAGGPAIGPSHAVLVRVRPRPDRAIDTRQLLDDVLRVSRRAPLTLASMLAVFDDGAFGLLELFADERDRRAHLTGPARQALAYRARDLFDGPPADVLLDVAAHDLPSGTRCSTFATGAWLTYDDLAVTGTSAELTVASERPAWLALRSDGGSLIVAELDDPAPQDADADAPLRRPDVRRAGIDLRLAAAGRFRLLGPDVPDVPDEAVTELRLPDLDLTPSDESVVSVGSVRQVTPGVA